MAKKSKRTGKAGTAAPAVPGSKEINQLLDEIVQESLNPDCNLIVLDGKIRDLEDALGKELLPFLSRRMRHGKGVEQKIILDLIVRSKNRMVIELLRRIADDPGSSLKARHRAYLQLQEWGEPVLEEGLNRLAEGVGVLNAIEKQIAVGNVSDRDLEGVIIQRFQELSPELRVLVVKQVLEEYPQHVSLVLRLIQDDADLDEKIIDILAAYDSQTVADLFGELLTQSTNKNTRRLIKKHLYRMQSKGLAIKIPPVGEDEPLNLRIVESPQASAYVSRIDYLGERLAFLSKSVKGWGVVFFQIALSDQEGIRTFNVFDLSRKEIKNFLKKVSETGNVQLIEISPEYCYYLINESFHVNLAKRIPLPEQFGQWKAELNELKAEIEEPLIYQYISRKELEGMDVYYWRAKYASLHEVDGFKQWFLEPRRVWEYIEKIKEVENSPLVLNKYQVEERISIIYSEAAGNIFNEELRRVYRRRLEEMALILYRNGDQDSARQALVAAKDLMPGELPSEKHEFLRSLVLKSINFYLEGEKEREQDKLVIAPR